jgi:hypothetical protein
MEDFVAANIDVVTLVSHKSHVSQPLDALVFGHMKKHQGSLENKYRIRPAQRSQI